LIRLCCYALKLYCVRRLSPLKQQQHARFPRLEQTLETGRQALGSPRPKPASLTSFKRLNLKDQKLSEFIEDSQYRRRKVRTTPRAIARRTSQQKLNQATL
jgi:hypothetical protein